MPRKQAFIATLTIIILAAFLAVVTGKYYAQTHPAVSPDLTALRIALGNERRDVASDIGARNQSDQGQEIDELDYTFEKVRDNYYKPVDNASLLNGERTGLVAFLKAKHVVASLPSAAQALHGGTDDEAAANELLTDAFSSYGGRFSTGDLTYAAMQGMLGALNDPYTEALTPRDMRALTELMRGGDFGGIGVYIGNDPKTKRIIVLQPIPGTPAYRAGLRAGDVIESVDGHDTKGLDLDFAMGLIRGKAGSTVRLVIERKNAKQTVSVVRQVIIVPSVSYRMIRGDIGYVQLVDFGDRSARELSDALNALLRQGAKAIVLDLRNNGGGLLQAAVDISSKFVPDGPIVSTIDRRGQVETADANQDSIPPRPLVVLVNQFSASASEITAGAIQDSKAGVLIGTKTFGKGVVQTIYDLPDGGAVKITTARYVTPAGRDINKKGIAPNISVRMDPRVVGEDLSDRLRGKDVQLIAALNYLNKELASNTK